MHNAERHLLEPGDKWVKRQEQKFDRVLVDAPCTGTGTWRRNPDARTRLTEQDLAELTAKQAEILDQAQKLVKPGGKLVYATCSLLNDENEAQVEAFLTRTNLQTGPRGSAGSAARPTSAPVPGVHGTDGFFAAVLARLRDRHPPRQVAGRTRHRRGACRDLAQRLCGCCRTIFSPSLRQPARRPI